MPLFMRFLVPILLSAAALAETIVLNDGQRVVAPIILEKADTIVVDLGHEVLNIPRRNIHSISKDDPTSAPVAGSSVVATEHLYSTADLPPSTVKALTERFGEGVLLVASPASLGSGFFISDQGHLITNVHVIEGETKISVMIFRKVGQEFRRQKIEEVDIVATNPFLDLALLKANLPEGYKPVVTYLATDDDLRDGDRVFAIGNPLGLERSVSEGIVSRRNRAEEGLAFIQTTTQINPGNSGGPLFNMRGQVIGVTNMKITSAEGLSFAIPVRYVIDFLRNREAFAYDSQASTAGYRYLQPPARQDSSWPEILRKK